MSKDVLWWALTAYLFAVVAGCLDNVVRDETRRDRVIALVVVSFLLPMLFGVWFWAPWGQG